MTHGGRRNKGRRLQVEVAEAIAAHFGLTIEAQPHGERGKRPGGAVYVGETDCPDIRIRRSGEPGSDVCLLSARAREKFPFWIECKNNESFDLASFANGATDFIRKAFQQCRERPAVVIWRKNRHPAWAFMELPADGVAVPINLPLVASPPFVAIKFEDMLDAAGRRLTMPFNDVRALF